MRRRRRYFAWFFLGVLVSVTTAAAFWFGLVPQRWSPLAPLDLDKPDDWFIDFKLAALHGDQKLCQSVLKAPAIDSTPVRDQPYKNGCGWRNAVKVEAAGGASIGVDTLSCEAAAALALWVAHDVQPEAQATFGSSVKGFETMGTYSCRNIVGNPFWRDFRSQHAIANAIDISAVRLADGRSISVLKDWRGDSTEAKFLRSIHRKACKYFRVALGPDFNKAHENHFHFDRGPLSTCK